METLNKFCPEAQKDFLNKLHETVIRGDEKSLVALEELSGIAAGGHKDAMKLIRQIDEKVSTGQLIFPNNINSNLDSPSTIDTSPAKLKIKDTLFIASHPVLALKAKLRQLAMLIDENEAPPNTSTIEEFPTLSLADATRAIEAAQKK